MADKRRISIFPLSGALLFPGLQLPLHIFEPRYRALISDALARDQMIGMIQPRGSDAPGSPAPLFDIGCLGKIVEFEAADDGRYNILLEGIGLFRMLRELDAATAFRQIEAEMLPQPEDEVLASIERAALEREAKRFAAWLDYRVDWDGVAGLDDVTLTNVIAQIAPFDVAAKQALLEARSLGERAELAMQLMRFASSGPSPDEGRATMQ